MFTRCSRELGACETDRGTNYDSNSRTIQDRIHVDDFVEPLAFGVYPRLRSGGNLGANGWFFSQLPFKYHLEEAASVGD